MEFLHAIIVLSNFVVIPAIAYGSQYHLINLGKRYGIPGLVGSELPIRKEL